MERALRSILFGYKNLQNYKPIVGTFQAKGGDMNSNAYSPRRLKSHRRFPILTFAVALVLATGGITLAATSYSHRADSATAAALTPQAKSRDCGHPRGCVFPAATTFAGR